MEYQALLPGVPLAVGANRLVAIQEAIRSSPGVDCAILDDGFQHRRLARRLDIVLIDSTRHCLEGELLPAGWLREPATALRRADAVVVTRAAGVDPTLQALVERYHGRPPMAWCRHAWATLDLFQPDPDGGWVSSHEPVSWLLGRSVVAAAALGNPAPFLHQLEAAGATVKHAVLRRDHAPYSVSDARGLNELACQGGSILATTWKDWTKLSTPLARVSGNGHMTVVVPRVETEFECGEAEITKALQRAVASR
jgi:tetraacyldisaccharide 4'-kinase